MAAFHDLPYGPPRRKRGARRILRDNGQRAVILVEPLFSYNGLGTSRKLMDLIRFRGHVVVDGFFDWAGPLLDRYGVKAKLCRMIRVYG